MRSRRVVLKIGSSSLTDRDLGGLSRAAIDAFVQIGVAARSSDTDVVIVTSGAIASGFKAIGYPRKPSVIRKKQAAAAVGQGLLMHAYSDSFARHGAVVAQVLLTRAELAERGAFDNAFATLDELLENDVVPIVNENDSIATEELTFGDNDILSAYVAGLVHADMLLILTDTDGLYESNPRTNPEARRIPSVPAVTAEILDMASGAGSAVGTGGMRAKVVAADVSIAFGVPVFVGQASGEQTVGDVLDGHGRGTYFGNREAHSVSKRKQWIGLHAKASGTVLIDQGAARAILDRNGSLLAVGVARVTGEFVCGDVVEIVDALSGRCIARGAVKCSSAEIVRGVSEGGASVRGLEVVHRDDLVVVAVRE